MTRQVTHAKCLTLHLHLDQASGMQDLEAFAAIICKSGKILLSPNPNPGWGLAGGQPGCMQACCQQILAGSEVDMALAVRPQPE